MIIYIIFGVNNIFLYKLISFYQKSTLRMHIWTSWCVLGCPRVSWGIKTDRFVNEASKHLYRREKQTTFLLWSVLQGLTQTMHDVFITEPVNMCL